MQKFTGDDLVNLLREAERNPKKRYARAMQSENFTGPQILINAILPGSYHRPHKHSYRETFIALHGKGDIVYFTESGNFIDKLPLSPVDNIYVEVPEGRYHGFVAQLPTVILGISQGPYDPTSKILASWAPEELTENADKYLEDLRRTIGR